MSYPKVSFKIALLRGHKMQLPQGRSLVLGLLVICGTINCSFPQSFNASSAAADLFKSRCVLCHGADGAGKTTLGQQLKASDLHSAKVQKQSDAGLKQSILHGKGNMPPFQAQLTIEQVDQLLKYVRRLGKNK
jgi:cytochrome c6